MIQKEEHASYFFLFVLIGLVVLSFFLIKPLLIAILGAIVISYFFYPVYKWLNKIIKNRSVCSAVVTIIILLLVIVPSIFLVRTFINETTGLYSIIKESGFMPLLNKASDYVKDQIGFRIEAQDLTGAVSKYVIGQISNFLIKLPAMIIGLFVLILLVYYFLKDGALLGKGFSESIPLSKEKKDRLKKKFKEVLGATVYGVILIGIVQGLLGGLGFWIFHVKAPITWGIVMMILSILPFVGPPVVWLPASLWLMFVNNDWFNGIGLLIYGTFVISLADNFIRPKVVGDKTGLHPALVLVGVFGGIALFGALGVLIGPMILAVLDVFIEFYRSEYVIKS